MENINSYDAILLFKQNYWLECYNVTGFKRIDDINTISPIYNKIDEKIANEIYKINYCPFSYIESIPKGIGFFKEKAIKNYIKEFGGHLLYIPKLDKIFICDAILDGMGYERGSEYFHIENLSELEANKIHKHIKDSVKLREIKKLELFNKRISARKYAINKMLNMFR